MAKIKIDFQCQVAGTVEVEIPDREFDGVDVSEPFDLCEYVENVLGTESGEIGDAIELCIPVNMDRQGGTTTIDGASFIEAPDVDDNDADDLS
jgi:hypothetical protein